VLFSNDVHGEALAQVKIKSWHLSGRTEGNDNKRESG